MPGLFAAGECACVSVHGANRLGGNSLLEAVVYGAITGESASQHVAGANGAGNGASPAHAKEYERQVARMLERTDGPGQHEIRNRLADTMQENVGVFRTGAELEKAKSDIDELKEQFTNVTVDDKGSIFNQSLIHAIETGYLLDLADTMVTGAIARTESRGAHSRTDFPERDDEHWMKHTLAYLEDDQIRLDYSEVTMTKYEPQVRTY
jgi:succinate dehydrogenase / fumarate reductase flavoprotein subunit